MRRSFLSLLLALSGAANAAVLPRVSLESPPAPVSALSLSAAPQFLGAAVPLAFPAALPAPALPPAARAETAAAALPVPAGLASPASAAFAPSASASNESSEDSVQALEHVFDEAAKHADAARDPLFTSLLQHVRLDDGGVPERRAALTRAVARMLETPTARALAERFIADGVPAVVRFEPFEGSRLLEVDGRKVFGAPRAFTEWKDDHVEVRMNLDYLGTSAEFQEQDIPATLAHELLGHGPWYARAARENALEAFHSHELNETNARLVGWLVDFELDHRFEDDVAWTYMENPEAFLSLLKLRLPYYALTWSTAELARPRETLEERSLAARAKRERLRDELANHLSWNPVIRYFVSHGAVAETSLRALRAYMAETEKSYEDEIAIMDSLIAEVDATVERMNAEPDRRSERYLRSAAAHPLFDGLRRETDENTRKLVEQIGRTSARSDDASEAAAKARADHWRGQLTFEGLVKLYNRDQERHPEHWQR